MTSSSVYMDIKLWYNYIYALQFHGTIIKLTQDPQNFYSKYSILN